MGKGSTKDTKFKKNSYKYKIETF